MNCPVCDIRVGDSLGVHVANCHTVNGKCGCGQKLVSIPGLEDWITMGSFYHEHLNTCPWWKSQVVASVLGEL